MFQGGEGPRGQLTENLKNSKLDIFFIFDPFSNGNVNSEYISIFWLTIFSRLERGPNFHFLVRVIRCFSYFGEVFF